VLLEKHPKVLVTCKCPACRASSASIRYESDDLHAATLRDYGLQRIATIMS
jgi:hypothetical protein